MVAVPGRRRASRSRACAGRSRVSTSGSQSRAAAASRAASVERVRPQQPAELRARRPGTIVPSGSTAIASGPSAPSRSRSSAASRSQRVVARQPRRARAGPRARRPGCRRRPAATRARCRRGAGSRRCPRRRRGSIASRQPCWESAPQVPAAQRTKPPPRSSAPSSHSPAARHAPASSSASARSPSAASSDEEPRRRVGRCRSRRTGPRAASPTPRSTSGGASRNSWPILPGSSSVPGCSSRPCSARQRAQRRARDVRALGQHLQRADQRVAPEQRVEAARVARLDRRRRGVRPALLGEQLVEPGDAHAQLHARRPRPAPSRSAPATASPSRARSVPTSTRAGQALDRHRRVAEVHRHGRAVAAPPRPRAVGRRQRLVGARRAGPARSRRSAIRSRTRCRTEPGSSRWAATLCGREVAERQPRRARRPAVKPPPGAVAPLHRRAADVAVLLGVAEPRRDRVERLRRVQRRVGQPDLVAVVEERRAAQAEQHQQRRARARGVAARPARREPLAVVVGARPHRPRALGQHRLDALDDRRAAAPASRSQWTNRKLNARCSSSSPCRRTGSAARGRARRSPPRAPARAPSRAAASARQRRSTSCSSGRFIE